MTAKWGLFLCNCRRTLPLDLQKLVLPIAPAVLTVANEPSADIEAFAAAAKREQPEQILIACCAAPELFSKALDAAPAQYSKLHFVDLKKSCFSVHQETEPAHAKATRLLRAAMEAAEAKETPTYHPLTVGGRILIAGDATRRNQLAEKLRDAQPMFVVAAEDHAAIDSREPGHLYAGRVVEVKGRLGDFRVTIENFREPENVRHELKANQVVIISQDEKPSFKSRTGLHLLNHPSEADLDRAAERISDLIGEFLKPAHVAYSPDICAGGVAGEEACGICIGACPYDAISRDPENHLRMKVDHMACEGCGACVSACPTSALGFTDPSPQHLYNRLAALLARPPRHNGDERLIVLFHCAENGRRVLEQAGQQALAYPAGVLPVEVPCLRYVSEANMLAAFHFGADGVALLGCQECPHGERERLLERIEFSRITLDAFGLGVERLRLITADDGTEREAITSVSSFAEAQDSTPIRWSGKPIDHLGNREVTAAVLRTFIEQTGKQPGGRALGPAYSFASAEVQASGCTMCRSCVNVCPTHAFRLDEKSQSLQFKHIACIACGLCEKVCPEDVIALRREILFEQGALEYKTVVQDDMVSCAKCGKPYINRKALEAIEGRLLSLESLFDTFSGNRRNLLRMCPDCRTVVAMFEVEKGWKP